jgi:hypothetical protein
MFVQWTIHLFHANLHIIFADFIPGITQLPNSIPCFFESSIQLIMKTYVLHELQAKYPNLNFKK